MGKVLPMVRIKYDPDLIIANGENSAGGLGIIHKTAFELFQAGVDIITTGNHVWDKKDAPEELQVSQNLVYHKDAITFATADLLLPQGVDMASRAVHNGISLRVVRQYDINNDRMPCRIDVLYGYSTIRPQMAVRMWG